MYIHIYIRIYSKNKVNFLSSPFYFVLKKFLK